MSLCLGPPWGPHPDLVRFLLDCGAPVDERLPYYAVSSGSIAIFQVLVERGWDINSNIEGLGPVIWYAINPSTSLNLRFYTDHT